MKRLKGLRTVVRQYGNAQFLFFLLLATALWYMNKMSAVYTDQIRVPVDIVGADPTIDSDDNKYFDITMKVKANGFALLKNRWFGFPSKIHIPLNDLTLTKVSGTDYYAIGIPSLERALSSRLNSSFDLLTVTDAEVTAYVNRYTSKTVPVKPDITLDMKGQYMQVGDVFVQPSVLTIAGKENDLNRIDYLKTKPVTVRSPVSDVSGVLEIVAVEDVIIPDQSIRYKIELEQYTEQKFMLPVRVYLGTDSLKNRTDGFTVIPDSVRVVCNVTKSNFNKFRIQDARAAVFYVPDRNNRYPVDVSVRLKGVEVVSVDPMYVTVLKNE